MTHDDDEYRVGPGRPPREHRFKKGQSGNPGGREPGRKNYRTILLEELEREIAVVGTDKRMSVLRGLIKKYIQKGFDGELRALEGILDRAERHSEREVVARVETADEDEAILRRLLGGTT